MRPLTPVTRTSGEFPGKAISDDTMESHEATLLWPSAGAWIQRGTPSASQRSQLTQLEIKLDGSEAILLAINQ